MIPSSRSFALKGGGHRYAVEHGVHRHAGQPLLLGQGDPELLVGLQELGIDLLQLFGCFFSFGAE